jgi:hypothetical protein
MQYLRVVGVAVADAPGRNASVIISEKYLQESRSLPIVLLEEDFIGDNLKDVTIGADQYSYEFFPTAN